MHVDDNDMTGYKLDSQCLISDIDMCLFFATGPRLALDPLIPLTPPHAKIPAHVIFSL
jgi:hypothetical protein